MSIDSVTVELDIVADDLGYCPERNRSIGECFSKGVVTRATLLVNFAASEAACQLAAELGLPLGLHLNLTEGRPLTGESNTLLDPLRPSEMRGKIGFQEAWRLGVVSATDVRAEVVAQVERFKALTGGYPRWVDGHQHVHVIPEVAEWIMEALLVYCAAVKSYRLPLVRSATEREALSPFLQEVSQQAALLEDRVLERFPESNRIFVGASTMGRLSTREAASSTLVRERAALLQLQPGHCSSVVRAEWMVHPGHPSQEPHADDFARSDERLHEHLLLLDSHNQLRQCLLNEVGVVLPSR